MNFLQPLTLIALPLVLLPVIIHLINQQRHRTVPWAAMMFLMTAKRMSKGMARIRHILILLMRVLAIWRLVREYRVRKTGCYNDTTRPIREYGSTRFASR